MSFKSVQKKIEGEGHSAASAGAILASASRHASKAAKKANPKLKRVKGGNDWISTSSLKGRELSSDAKANLAAKNEFKAGCNCEHGDWCDCK
jgi:hypothetical protein